MSGLGVAEATLPVFARHETFHPRHGWFRKAVVGTRESEQIFTADDATVRLGVGKNMVRAIRFWANAAKVVEPIADSNHPRTPRYRETTLGRVLFSEDGWDPWLEATASLWVLHWMMLRPPSILPVWWLALNEFQSIEFSDDDLTRYVKQVIRGVDGWGEVAPSSVKKDVDCFLRTYSPVSGRESRDDNIDCPFRVIGLISPVPGERRMYRFLVGPKVTLPDEILAFACLDFVGESTRMRTATLTRLAVDPGSPGRVFRLNEDSITESLQRLEMAGSLIKVSTVAGITQISWEGQPADLAWGILSDYFQRASGSSRVMTSVARERVHGDTQPNPNGDVHLDMPNVQIPDTSDVMARLKLIRRKQEIPLGAAK